MKFTRERKKMIIILKSGVELIICSANRGDILKCNYRWLSCFSLSLSLTHLLGANKNALNACSSLHRKWFLTIINVSANYFHSARPNKGVQYVNFRLTNEFASRCGWLWLARWNIRFEFDFEVLMWILWI